MAAVVVHGFTGAPWDMHPLAEGLAAVGVHAHVPLLCGHERGPAGVAAATLADWRADVADELRRLHVITGRPVLLVGMSMGGLLVLDAAIRRVAPIAGLAVLAAPLTLGRASRLAAGAARLVADLQGPVAAQALVLAKRGGSDIANGLEMPGADGIPLLALGEVFGLMDAVRARIEAVEAPLLVVHAAQDHTAPVDGAWELHHRASSRRGRLVILDEGFHILPRDVTRARVVAEVSGWAQTLGAPGAAAGQPGVDPVRVRRVGRSPSRARAARRRQ